LILAETAARLLSATSLFSSGAAVASRLVCARKNRPSAKLPEQGQYFEPLRFPGRRTVCRGARPRERPEAQLKFRSSRRIKHPGSNELIWIISDPSSFTTGNHQASRPQDQNRSLPGRHVGSLRSVRPPEIVSQHSRGRPVRGGAADRPALSRQISIGHFRRRIRPRALVIREQKQLSTRPPWRKQAV
jgi:hypothetical protein